jgi:hypothetical protein
MQKPNPYGQKGLQNKIFKIRFESAEILNYNISGLTQCVPK